MNEINIICSSFEEIQTQNNGSILSVFNLNHVEFSNNFVFKVSSTTFPGCLYVTNTNLLKVTHNSFQSCFSSGGNAHFGQVLLSLSTNVICSHITASSCSPSSTEYGDSLFRDESSTLDADQINISYSYDEAIGSSSFSLNQNNDHTNMKFLNVAHTFSFTSLEITSTMNDGCKCLCQLSNFINTSNNRNVLSIGYETIIDTCVFIEHFPINVTRYPQYTIWCHVFIWIDICSHWAHMLAQLSAGEKSHKIVHSGPWLLRFYYSCHNFMVLLIVGAEGLPLALYLLSHAEFVAQPILTAMHYFLYGLTPLFLLKHFINIIQFIHAAESLDHPPEVKKD